MVQAPWRGHPFPCQGFRVSQESCQPCSYQAETCTGCHLHRLPRQGSGQWQRAPATPVGQQPPPYQHGWSLGGSVHIYPHPSHVHQALEQSPDTYADSRYLPLHCASKIPGFIEGSSLLILTHCVCGSKHCPLSTYLPGFRASASPRAASLLPPSVRHCIRDSPSIQYHPSSMDLQ